MSHRKIDLCHSTIHEFIKHTNVLNKARHFIKQYIHLRVQRINEIDRKSTRLNSSHRL